MIGLKALKWHITMYYKYRNDYCILNKLCETYMFLHMFKGFDVHTEWLLIKGLYLIFLNKALIGIYSYIMWKHAIG